MSAWGFCARRRVGGARRRGDRRRRCRREGGARVEGSVEEQIGGGVSLRRGQRRVIRHRAVVQCGDDDPAVAMPVFDPTWPGAVLEHLGCAAGNGSTMPRSVLAQWSKSVALRGKPPVPSPVM